MRKLLKTLFAVTLGALLLLSCSKDSTKYHKLVYEATSSPSVNMSIRFRMPNKDSMFGTAGSSLKQDCGYVADTFMAQIEAEINDQADGDSQVTVRIYLDDKCVAEKTGNNSASVSYCENPITQ